MSDTPTAAVYDLTHDFPTGARSHAPVRALDGVSLSLYPGRITALVGESGSGKSTVAHVLARLLRPTEGRIELNGKTASWSSKALFAYRREVQMVFQDPFASLNPSLRLGYQLTRPMLRHRLVSDKKSAIKRATDLLENVGMSASKNLLSLFPHELSGGQRQRIAIARALSLSPRVLLADEPTSMLDVSIRVGILNLLTDLRQQSIAQLFITHDLASARYVADEICVMYKGQIVESAPTEELLRDPKHPYTRALLAAVPDAGQRLTTQGQSRPSPAPDATKGCHFFARCPESRTECAKLPPPLIQLGQRAVRCVLHPPSTTEHTS